MIVNQYCGYRASPGCGLGVFARRRIQAGTVILRDLFRSIGPADAQIVGNTSLRDHLFASRDPELKDRGQAGLHLAFGASSIINHSDEENCRLDWEFGGSFPQVLAVTIRTIEAGEEIYIRYADLDSYEQENFI